MEDEIRIRRSMLWSAYGDALGFITEMCDSSTLSHRTSGITRVTELIPWKRKIGGLSGVTWHFPLGTYSDDTQLRLAVCRSIRGDGYFDVEPFAKVELPIFLSYALGAGIGTKVAAESLKKKSVTWNTNFFENSNSKYVNGGGNGAAMRIQPHVWAASRSSSDAVILRNVLRDSVVTHGHPVGLIGAAFHSIHLRQTLEHGIVEPGGWAQIADRIKNLPQIAANDDDLSLLWIPEWERRTGRRFEDATEEVVRDLYHDIKLVWDVLSASEGGDPELTYEKSAKCINAFDKRCRGSGVKTALLAAVAAHLYQEDCHGGMVACANQLGTDTDTIATMAGAILGLYTAGDPPEDVADKEYLIYQANRLSDIRNSKKGDTHLYPNLLSWCPPQNNLDAVAGSEEKTYLRGFGELICEGKRIDQEGKYPTVWESFKLTHGQSVIVKRRHKIPDLCSSDLPSKHNPPAVLASTAQIEMKLEPDQKTLTVDQASDLAIRSAFDPETTGKALMALAEQDGGIEKAIAFAAIMAKAKLARNKRQG